MCHIASPKWRPNAEIAWHHDRYPRHWSTKPASYFGKNDTISMRSYSSNAMKTTFIIDFALSLAFIMRFTATRKWPPSSVCICVEPRGYQRGRLSGGGGGGGEKGLLNSFLSNYNHRQISLERLLKKGPVRNSLWMVWSLSLVTHVYTVVCIPPSPNSMLASPAMNMQNSTLRQGRGGKSLRGES